MDERVRESTDLLLRAHSEYGDRIVFLTSFSMEDNVLTDLMDREKISIEHYTLDTGRLPQETYDVMDAIAKKYGIVPKVAFPDAAEVEEMVRKHGINLFLDSVYLRELCCRIRKTGSLDRILSGYEAWISGIRGDQTSIRRSSKMEEPDPLHNGIRKFNPLLNWTARDVREYTELFDIPFNALYLRGYKSIGCAPCTRAVSPDESERSGRWWWENSIKECGIHASFDVKPALKEND